jgi:putative ABC transport system permease protein
MSRSRSGARHVQGYRRPVREPRAAGYLLARIAGSYFETARMPGVLPVLGAAFVLMGAAVVASLIPAARASRVDVLQALQSE